MNWFFLLFTSESKIRKRLELLEHELKQVNEGRISTKHLRNNGSVNEVALKIEKRIKKLKSRLDR